ncbi:MAG: PEP-CTERM sorting domain-containing protein [Bryobacteraceae bacterium]
MNFWANRLAPLGELQTMNFTAKDPRSGFEKKLAAYALAGGALLAMPNAASAAIITVTPGSPIAIGVATGEGSTQYDLDMDGDNTTDFTMRAGSTLGEGLGYYNFVDVLAGAGNSMVMTGKKSYFARGYTTGTLPAQGAFFNSTGTLLSGYDGGNGITTSGDWPNSLRQSRFLAVQFLHNGNLTGGWIEIAVHLGSADAQINSWAYDDPNAATPEPSSMALFAAGAAGVAAFRRRKRAQ